MDTYSNGVDHVGSYPLNQVTFVYCVTETSVPQQVAVIGTFANLYEPIPLRLIADTPFFTATMVIPKGEVHLYKYVVDGQAVVDPINPQRVIQDNGRVWSRFFTQLATEPISFERWELAILNRLSEHILPFETAEGSNFLTRFYNNLDQQSKEMQYVHAYRLDQPIGVANYIDKVVTKEENHHLLDYKTCLSLIDRVLRQRNPYVEPISHFIEKGMDALGMQRYRPRSVSTQIWLTCA